MITFILPRDGRRREFTVGTLLRDPRTGRTYKITSIEGRYGKAEPT